MRPDFFVVFPDKPTCVAALDKVTLATGQVWAEPLDNAFDGRWIIPWSNAALADFADLVHKLPKLSRDQAIKQSFNLDFYKGPFAQAERKLEDAFFLVEILPDALQAKQFPLVKALFYALQGALYATREGLKKTCIKHSKEARTWWAGLDRSISTDYPFVNLLHVDYNRDKHNEGSSILHPVLSALSYQGEYFSRISGEGAFVIQASPHGRLMRRFTDGIVGKFEVKIEVSNYRLGHMDLAGMPITDQMKAVVGVHDKWVSEAITLFPKKEKN
jgi:hypothetical protein